MNPMEDPILWYVTFMQVYPATAVCGPDRRNTITGTSAKHIIARPMPTDKTFNPDAALTRALEALEVRVS